ncbi:MAG: hypothetical protein ABEJ34_08980 [Haloferacaceae archaeon]
MRRTVQAVAALALTAAAATMLLAGCGVAAPEASGAAPLVRAAVAATALPCIAHVALRELRRVVDGTFVLTRTDAVSVVAVTVAAPLTRWLAFEAALGAVIAAGLVGLLSHLVAADYGVPAYCGSFVGMVHPEVFAGDVTVAAAGAVAGVTFVAAKRVFNGFGGKLGTTAFVGCATVALATGSTPAPASPLAPTVAALSVGAAALAAVATFVLSIRLDHGPVVGSAVVGIVAGLLCPALAPAGGTVAAAAFCASFAGMARPDRIPNETVMSFAGVVAGGLFVGVAPHFGGFGGKLGTVAFVACLATDGLLSLGGLVLPAGAGTPSR